MTDAEVEQIVRCVLSSRTRPAPADKVEAGKRELKT
jgi:hypothetical protein